MRARIMMPLSLSRSRLRRLLSVPFSNLPPATLSSFPSAGLASSSSATGGPPGKHLDLGIVVPPHRLLRTMFAPLLFGVLRGYVVRATSAWQFQKVCDLFPFSCTGEGESCRGAGRPSRPFPPACLVPPYLCLARSLLDSCTPWRTPRSIARHYQMWCNVFGLPSALVRESDQSGADGAAIDARS